MSPKLVEAAGWYGIGAILSAYALSSFGVISTIELPYQLLNLSGAIGVIIVSVAKGVKQTIVLNAVWAIVAVIAIGVIAFR